MHLSCMRISDYFLAKKVSVEYGYLLVRLLFFQVC